MEIASRSMNSISTPNSALSSAETLSTHLERQESVFRGFSSTLASIESYQRSLLWLGGFLAGFALDLQGLAFYAAFLWIFTTLTAPRNARRARISIVLLALAAFFVEHLLVARATDAAARVAHCPR